jgi:calcium-dependent protein kinase
MGACQSVDESAHVVAPTVAKSEQHKNSTSNGSYKTRESNEGTPKNTTILTNGTSNSMVAERSSGNCHDTKSDTGSSMISAASHSTGGAGGATAALAALSAASSASGSSNSTIDVPGLSSTGAVGGHSGQDDVSSIGSGTVGSNSNGNNNKRSSGNLGHRSRLSLGNSSSVIGLDSMIESRREEGGLTANVVHMEVPFGKPIEEVYDGVQTGPVLGSGISGVVRLVTHKATGVKYAVKCLDLGLVDTEEGLMQLREEIYIMCQLDHPNIVRLEEVYESHSEIYLVQELCLGGELFDRLDEQPDYHYTEAECARLIKQMLCAVRYLHSKGIIHRDLKLENFLFSSSAPDSELKMIDFGLSKHFQYGEIQQQAVGTPYTVAPEVIRGRYDERCDIWAIGVIAFLLLSGDPPFGGCGGPEPLMQVRANILNGAFEFEPAEIWDLVSDSARDFINALLVTNPKLRPTAMDAQKLSWLTEWANRTKTDNDHILNPNVVRALVNFKEFSDMRKLLCEVLSFTLLPEQIKDLRKEFETLDTEGSGEISLLSLKQVLVTNAGSGSLGALTEEEVEDIFNAMRVKKTETTIRWHEFIAAGLSQCEVDDRNLRLAFDRLDNDHKGYVTLDDIMDLMGSDAVQGEEALRKMWRDSMKDCNCSAARITYEDFVLIMKVQTRDFESEGPVTRIDSGQGLTGALLHAVNEMDEAETNLRSNNTKSNSNGQLLVDPKRVTVGTPQKRRSINSFPPHLTPEVSEDPLVMDSPLSMDDNDGLPNSLHFPAMPALPSTPTRGAIDLMSPISESKIKPSSGRSAQAMDNLLAESTTSDPEQSSCYAIPQAPKPAIIHTRVKSRSFDEREMKKSFDMDSRRAVALPEHDPEKKKLIVNDNKMSALQVNRHLYRSHRQMRLSVIDACKRFEEQQAKHAHGVLLAEKNKASNMGGFAGLVMRRVENKTVSTEEIKNRLEQNRKQHQDLMEKANRRSGGRRSRRKRTVSDLSAMMGSLSSEEMTKISIQAQESSVDFLLKQPPSLAIPPVIETKPLENPSDNFRPATVPGDFRKVNDPFGSRGKYAAMMTSN